MRFVLQLIIASFLCCTEAIAQQELFEAQNEQGKLGYATRQGQWVIQPLYDSVAPFIDGEAVVTIGGRDGTITIDGKWKLPPNYKSLARVARGKYVAQDDQKKYGIINSHGDWLVKPKYAAVYFDFESVVNSSIDNPLVCFSMEDNYKSQRFGFADLAGNEVITPKYMGPTHFSEGLAAVVLEPQPGQDYLPHVIDTSGTVVVKAQYKLIKRFSEGLAAAKLDDKYGFIDRTGKMVIHPQFEDAKHFREGLCPVEIAGKWGYIDKKGEVVIAPIYVDADPFKKGIAEISLGKKDQAGLITKDGNFFVTPVYKHVRWYNDTSYFAFFTPDDQRGYFDQQKQVFLQQPNYSYIIMSRNNINGMRKILEGY